MDFKNLLLIESMFIERVLSKKIEEKDFEMHKSALPMDILFKILKDPKKKIQDDFKIPPYFKKQVIFWTQIYTQFNSEQILIHDKNDLSIVYDAVDYTPLKKAGLNPYQIASKRHFMSMNVVKKIKKSLFALSRTTRPKFIHGQNLQRHLIKIGLKKPKNISRKKFFRTLAMNVRVQTGQRDKIFQGLLNAFPFENFIQDLFKAFELPHELLALAFVESSFNPRATSRIGAKGVWQIMPSISRRLFYENKNIQPRRNTLLSTLGAFHLLAQNYKILKRWDLAITAYNSGFKHLLRARRKFRKKNISLPFIFKNYQSRHLGFASKNFFSEFLALVYTLKYKETLFPLQGIQYENIDKNPKIRYGHINAYISKCGFMPQRLYSSFLKKSPHLPKINTHIKFSKKIYPRGTLVFSDQNLSKERYYKLSLNQLRRNYPKNYRKLIKKNPCKIIQYNKHKDSRL